ncbi:MULTISPECIES: hypothetical protein, partial [unclassified Dysgonomonas]|uniref:hypothetical protein n=1 Tax=unclassified Dysgonomonas TaxID=2630389 RepID=UPI0024749933
ILVLLFILVIIDFKDRFLCFKEGLSLQSPFCLKAGAKIKNKITKYKIKKEVFLPYFKTISQPSNSQHIAK